MAQEKRFLQEKRSAVHHSSRRRRLDRGRRKALIGLLGGLSVVSVGGGTLWFKVNGNLLTTLGQMFLEKGHSESVNAVAWSPDSTHLASASDDMSVMVWKPAL